MTDTTQHNYAVVTAVEPGDLPQASGRVMAESWPQFMMNCAAVKKYWPDLYSRFPEYQFGFIHPETAEVYAAGNCIPLAWDEEFDALPDGGLEWALEKGFADRDAGRTPTVLCALFVAVAKEHRGRGLGLPAVRAAKMIGQAHGLCGMIAPVRPVFKSRYPLTPMNRYIRWRNSRGVPLDAWLSACTRAGAEIIKVCTNSIRVVGSIAEWEQWTNMRFPENGTYIVPGALVPVRIDRQKDTGTYIEPSVWMACALEK